MFKYSLVTSLFLSCTCSAFINFGFGEVIGGSPAVVEEPVVVEKPRVMKKTTYTQDDSPNSDPNEVYVEENLNGKKVLVKEAAPKEDVYHKEMVNGKEVLVQDTQPPAKKKRAKKTETVVEEEPTTEVIERPVVYPGYPVEEFGLGFGFGGPWHRRHWR